MVELRLWVSAVVALVCVLGSAGEVRAQSASGELALPPRSLCGGEASSCVGNPLRFSEAELQSSVRRNRWIGAAAGFVVGAGVTYAVLHSGGSTSPCDRDANQDAMSSTECWAITLGGGAVGAGLGALLAGLFRPDAADETRLDHIRVGWTPGGAAHAGVRLPLPVNGGTR